MSATAEEIRNIGMGIPVSGTITSDTVKLYNRDDGEWPGKAVSGGSVERRSTLASIQHTGERSTFVGVQSA